MLDTLPCGSLSITQAKTMLLLLGTTNNCSATIQNKSLAAIIIYNHTVHSATVQTHGEE